MAKKTLADSMRLALGGMTEEAHKELADSGYKPKDDSRKEYVDSEGLEMPATKMYKIMKSGTKKAPSYPTPN